MNTAFSFLQIKEKFISLSQREQLLVILVLGAAAYFLVDGLILLPQAKREAVMQAQLATTKNRVLALRTEIHAVSSTSAEMRARQQADFLVLKQKYANLQAIAKSVSSTEAPRIADLVKDVLRTQHPRVTLDNLRTLPVKRLSSAAAPSGNPSQGAGNSQPVALAPDVYRYGVELTLQGSYLDLMAYLKSLEDSGNNLFWSGATLSTGRYPMTTLRVTVYVLSPKPNLGVS